MKRQNIYYTIALFIAICCNMNTASSQATSSDPLSPAAAGPDTPSAGGGDFLGWAPGVGVPLDIRHDGLANIDFYTGGALPANLRMTILGTGSALMIRLFRLFVYDSGNQMLQLKEGCQRGVEIRLLNLAGTAAFFWNVF